MTRAVLSLSLCATLLGLGLVTVSIQSLNHQQGEVLDRKKRQNDWLEAGNETLEADILAREFALELEGQVVADQGPSR